MTVCDPAKRVKLHLTDCINIREAEALKDLIRSTTPKLVFLMETKMQLNKMSKLRFSLGFRNAFGVDHVGFGGGLLLLWNDV